MKTSDYSAPSQKAKGVLRPPKYVLPRGWFRKRRMPAYLADAPICFTFGASEACFIRALDYWLKHSKNIHDHRLWSYNSLSAWCGYSGLKIGALRRVIDNLKEQEILLTWRPNRRKPTWYSLDYAKLRQMVAASLKEKGDWPYPECDRIDHTESDSSNHTQRPELYRTDHTQRPESDRSDHAIQEPNKKQETPLKQETQAEQQQTNSTVVVKNMISNGEAHTDRSNELSINSSQKRDIGYELRETGEDANSAELKAIFQKFSAEFGTDIPDDIKAEMRAAGVSVCWGALNATLEKKRADKLERPVGFLRRAVAKQWMPLKKPPLNRELRELLDELGWNAGLVDKDWPNRPEEAIVVGDLKETDQQAYIDFMSQHLQARNQQAAELIDAIRNEWQRIGYDSGDDEVIETNWRIHRFTTLANVPRDPGYAGAYLAELRKRPDKGDIESDQKSFSSDSTSCITNTESSPQSMLSIGDILQKERLLS